MSIKMMTAVWASGPKDHVALLVLLAMADIADDDGLLWPTVATIASKARMSERNARRVIRLLEQEGWLQTTIAPGRSKTNSYRLNGAKIAGQESRTAWPGGQSDRTNPVGKPDRAVSPEPLRTVIREEEENPHQVRSIRAILAEVVTDETADAFIAHRKTKRAKLTAHAAELIARKLSGHPTPDAVMLESIANGWTGVFPNNQRGTGGRHDHRHFDSAIATVAAGLSAGTIRLDSASRDPFAKRPGPDPDPRDGGPSPLL